MEDIIKQLLAPGKGLLAADESTATITKRFAALGFISTPELNKKYREMLFSTPEIENYLGGVILFDENKVQTTRDHLKKMGCSSELSHIPKLIAIDIPPKINVQCITHFLAEGEKRGAERSDRGKGERALAGESALFDRVARAAATLRTRRRPGERYLRSVRHSAAVGNALSNTHAR